MDVVMGWVVVVAAVALMACQPGAGETLDTAAEQDTGGTHGAGLDTAAAEPCPDPGGESIVVDLPADPVYVDSSDEYVLVARLDGMGTICTWTCEHGSAALGYIVAGVDRGCGMEPVTDMSDPWEYVDPDDVDTWYLCVAPHIDGWQDDTCSLVATGASGTVALAVQ